MGNKIIYIGKNCKWKHGMNKKIMNRDESRYVLYNSLMIVDTTRRSKNTFHSTFCVVEST